MARNTQNRARRKPAAKQQAGTSAGEFALWSIAAAAVAGGAYLARATLKRGWDELTRPRNAEHAAPDLALDAPQPGTERAPDAFRPDPTAAVPASEREGLRPATGPAPTMVRGQPEQLERIGGGNA